MVFVAREMERRGFTLPLLIGGATTSPQHTAVKISHEYSGPVVHVLDASRAVDVVSSLLGDKRDEFDRANRETQEGTRQKYAGRKEKPLLTIEQARANRLKYDWDEHDIASPSFIGRRYLEEVASRGDCEVHRLDVLLHRLGAEGALPGDPGSSAAGSAPRASSTTTRRRC